MELIIKSFPDLNLMELYEILRARSEVFVVEQNCAYQDLDGLDYKSLHMFYTEGGKIQAYLRIYRKNDEANTYQIGRVITVARGIGLGRKLLHEAVEYIKTQLNPSRIYIGAQCYATGFYAKEGFEICSEQYMEDGIPHVHMDINCEAVEYPQNKRRYMFYGNEVADMLPLDPKFSKLNNPRDLYSLLMDVWCEYTCAPRLRSGWGPDNITLGQCSITAFLVQDIFGGEVYGILRPGGNYHCYNVIGNRAFDLTSEQFKDEVLSYEGNPVQERNSHFAKEEKRLRYEYLRKALKDAYTEMYGD